MKKQIFDILNRSPINILEEQDTYLEVIRWELTSKRHDDSTNIGSFNLVAALKMIAKELNTSVDDDSVFACFKEICETLVSEGYLRETPEYKRSLFKIV